MRIVKTLIIVLHFNSIKVQLEQSILRQTPYKHLYFNSIKVQLEQTWFEQHSFQLLDFNSIKVQLEQDEQAGRKLQTTFQFHKGTIRTLLQTVGTPGRQISIP